MSACKPTSVADELRLCCPTPVLYDGRLFIKNEGVSGITYGGNKVRKLTPLYQALNERGHTRLLTVGAAGSHHVLANALFAASSGLSCAAVLFPQPYSAHAADVLRLVASLDVTLYPCTTATDVARVLSRERGRAVAWSGPGALGACAASGYEAAFEEWLSQRPTLGLHDQFEHHVVAAGSGGTAAGLLAGLVKHAHRGRVVAVAVTRNPMLRATIAGQTWGVQRRFGRRPTPYFGSRLHLDTSAVGKGYGHPLQTTTSIIEQAQQVGLHLEQTYTAKAYAVAQNLAQQHPDDVVVFWQTLSQRPQPRLPELPTFQELAPALRRLLPAG